MVIGISPFIEGKWLSGLPHLPFTEGVFPFTEVHRWWWWRGEVIGEEGRCCVSGVGGRWWCLELVLTTIRVTRGYLAPEWILGVAITTKSDVYNHGMMLLEILSGRRNLKDFLNDNNKIFFPCLADDESIRPSMGRVVGILEWVTDVNVPPMPRSLRVLGARQEDMVFFTNPSRGVSSLVKSTTSSGSSIEMRV
ncbi:hypothetical protein BUALT_Bualt18G0018200 [Buddleja alternifolia]|uniref:Serine-threonine/tyrosine-protein kinase catalytic domain-containing protein n=1 Tax=Buddleja alternifolia TaxID=168488 RepID=A0AAV6W3X1_9LAMI|nr:hypothetical protein BUALT_Bualt18G0018200 [Buddleja alternifolia]